MISSAMLSRATVASAFNGASFQQNGKDCHFLLGKLL